MTKTSLLGPWVRRFLLEYLVSERNLARNTQRSYRDTLKLLLPFVGRQTHKQVDQIAVFDVSPDLVRLFLRHLEEGRKCIAATRNQRLAAIRSLARFVGLYCPEYVEWYGQLRNIPLKRAPRSSITYLEKSEMDALLNAPDQSTQQGCRDHTLLLFLYNTGARADEVAQIKIADLLFGFGVHTTVERYVQRIVGRILSLATKRVSPHTIRHTTATHLLRAGVDINTIRAWLGHVSLNTTNIYAEVDLEMKAKALATCEIRGTIPLNHLKEDISLMKFLRAL